MKRRITRLAAALALASSTGVAALALGVTPARADMSLLSWTAAADANMFDLVVDNANGLDGIHPLSEIDVPEDSSNYETGPLGYALASIVWPGAVLGNLGSVAGEVGLPSQLAPAANQFNDPIKAESFYPAGPASDTYPSGSPSAGALEMSSSADSTQSSAKAGITDASVPALFNLQSVQGSTSATASSVAHSSGSGSFNSLSLLGGLIQIGASSSAASAQSDGTTPSGTSSTIIGAITIAGQPVSIGSGGLVAGPAGGTLSGLLGLGTSAVNELASVLNLKMAVLPQTETKQGSDDTITSGGLSISFSLPSNLSASLDCSSLPSQLAQLNLLCHAPDELQGLSFTFTLGRVTASAFAEPPLALPSIAPLGLGLVPGSTSDFGGTPGTPGTPGTLGTLGSASLPGQSGSTTSPTSSTAPARSSGLLAVVLSSPIRAGLFAVLMAMALAFGFVLRRLATVAALAKPGESCPLEETP